jgi:Amt family ammonium transporter
MVIGRRKGHKKYPMEPSNIPLTVLGAFLLWFGWFGFNGGSALSSGGIATSAIVVTNLSGAAAALTWMLVSWMHKRPSVLGMSTGAIVGLATITPCAGYVNPMSAMLIGSVAAVVSYYAILIRMKSCLDDSLDVFACHGLGGIMGTLAVGLFAEKAINSSGANGLFFGNPAQFFIQLKAVLIVSIFTFVATFVIAKVIDTMFSLRAEEDEEEIGLDITQHGEAAFS